MNRLTHIPILVLIVSSLLLSSACAAVNIGYGQVEALQLGSTMWGIQHAYAGATGTRIFMDTNNGLVMFAWGIKDAWGFAVVSADYVKQGNTEAVIQMLRGNLVNPSTMNDFAKCLETNGWKVVTASELPQAIRIAIEGTNSTLVHAGVSLTTFLVIPASAVGDILDYATYEGGVYEGNT